MDEKQYSTMLAAWPTVDPDSHNAVVDSGLFRKILVRIELK